MALILNIESATDICSICLSRNEKVLALVESHEGNVHSEQITLLIADCMKKAGLKLEDLDAIGVSSGPGSYTSLRVGSSVAKGICYALEKPLIAVNTLQSIALASFEKEKVAPGVYVPMIDARRMEVYMAMFDHNNKQLTNIEAKILDEHTLNEWEVQKGPFIISGNGMGKSQTVLKSSNISFSKVLCSATHMVGLSYTAYKNNSFTDIAYFSPTYFKAPNITVSKKKTL